MIRVDNTKRIGSVSFFTIYRYEFYEYKKGKAKIPKMHKGRVQKVNQAHDLLVKVAVTNSDGDTFELALARTLQATKECQDMNAATNGAPEHNGVVPFPPPSRVGPKSSHDKADATNASRLSKILDEKHFGDARTLSEH